MTVIFSDLNHIEMTVPDIKEAYRILHNVLGAKKVQTDIEWEAVRFNHVILGDVLLQFVEPKVKYDDDLDIESPWYNHARSLARILETKGPGVHNLTFTVENLNDVVKELEKEGGIVPLFSFSARALWEKYIPSEILNPDAKTVYMMNSMEKLGFNLEIHTHLFKKGIPLPQPAKLSGSVSPMLHIGLVTGDLEKTYELLRKVFGSEKVEIDFAKFLDRPFLQSIHVKLSNVVLRYCQPTVKVKSAMNSWYELLEKNGSCVHNVTFAVDNMEETIEKFKIEGIEPLFTSNLKWNRLTDDMKAGARPVYMMNTMEKLGFHLELVERPKNKKELEAFSNFLFIDME